MNGLDGFILSKKDRGFRREPDGRLPMPPGVYEIRPDDFGNLIYHPHTDMGDNIIAKASPTILEVVNEIKTFWGAKNRFDDLGLVHKRGILLHGPAGCGKTVCLRLVGEELSKLNGFTFFAGQFWNLFSAAAEVRGVAKNPIALIIEDIDQWLQMEETLLADLDGKTQVEGLVVVATTNHLEKLPGRIKSRPSRFDRIIQIKPPALEARKLYLQTLFPGGDPELLDGIARASKGLSFAHIKELLIGVYCFQLSLDEATRQIKETVGKADSSDDESPKPKRSAKKAERLVWATASKPGN